MIQNIKINYIDFVFTGVFDVICINSINRDTEDVAHDNEKTSISLIIHFSLFCFI